MAPGILPVVTWSLRKSSMRESFSSDSVAFGCEPNSAADRDVVIEANAAIAANSVAYRPDDADLHMNIRWRPLNKLSGTYGIATCCGNVDISSRIRVDQLLLLGAVMCEHVDKGPDLRREMMT